MKTKYLAVLLFFLGMFIPCPAKDPPKFKTEDEAIEYYRKSLAKVDIFSTRAIFKVLIENPDEEEKAGIEKAANAFDASLDFVAKNVGSVSHLEVVSFPKLGDTIQKTSYFVFFDKNVLIANIWLIHTDKGWHMLNFSFVMNTSVEKTFEEFSDVNFGEVKKDEPVSLEKQ